MQENAGLAIKALRCSFQGIGCKVYRSGLRFWYFQIEASASKSRVCSTQTGFLGTEPNRTRVHESYYNY